MIYLSRSSAKDKNYKKSILRVSPLSYIACILIAFFATVAAYLAALATSFRVVLSDEHIAEHLGNKNFFTLHGDENEAAGLLSLLKSAMDHYYFYVFWSVALYLLISYICIYFASRRNSYTSLKCLSVIFVSSGILLILTALLSLVFKLHSRFSFINADNTKLFADYARSGFLMQAAFGLALLAFALLAEFLAITLAKRKVRQSKVMMQRQEDL